MSLCSTCWGQVRAGAQLLEVFDSWSGDLSPIDFERFGLPYLVQIAKQVKATLRNEGREVVPMTVFPRGRTLQFGAAGAAVAVQRHQSRLDDGAVESTQTPPQYVYPPRKLTDWEIRAHHTLVSSVAYGRDRSAYVVTGQFGAVCAVRG